MIKKRTVIASIITVCAVLFSNSFWLSFEPLTVGFGIKGSGTVNIEAVLNKKDNADFKKVKTGSEKIKLDEAATAKIEVENSKQPKRFKLDFSGYETKNPIIVGNITIDNDKLKLDKTEKFRAEKAKLIVNGDELTLIPEEFNCSLVYDEPLDVSCDVDFSIEILLIILILSFLVSYKITDYIADFKTVKNNSRIEIIFLTIFFIFMLLPISNINQAEVSDKEKRMLAVYKPLITEAGKLNLNFGNDFNDWFNDRFALRNYFINAYFSFKSLFAGKYCETLQLIYNKEADFAFNKSYNAQKVFLKSNLFTKEECEKITQNVEKLASYCEKHGVKLYILLSNDKESIYPEFYPKYYKQENNISRLEQLKSLFGGVKGINVVYPHDDIVNAKREGLIFRRYDTHLKDYGSFIEYYDLVSAIKTNFPSAKLLEKDDFEITPFKDPNGDCLGQSILSKKKFEEYDKYEPKTAYAKQLEKRDDTDKNIISVYKNDNSGNDLKVVIIGDSFHNEYLPYLAESFYKLYSAFFGGGRDYVLDEKTKKEFFALKPDILIIESTERFLDRFLRLDNLYDIFDGEETK